MPRTTRSNELLYGAITKRGRVKELLFTVVTVRGECKLCFYLILCCRAYTMSGEISYVSTYVCVVVWGSRSYF